MLISNFFSGDSNYKYFNSYMNGDYKVKPLHNMPSKPNARVKGYDG